MQCADVVQELRVRFKFALCWMKELMVFSARATSLTQQSELVHNEASEVAKPLNEWFLNGEAETKRFAS